MGTRRLTLLRHGQAQTIDTCTEDFERALTRRGTIEAQEMAARLVHRNLVPDLILVSPAERAWSTAEILAERLRTRQQARCNARASCIWRRPKRPGGCSRGATRALRHILICGHNPGLSQLASRLGPQAGAAQPCLPADSSRQSGKTRSWDTLQPETASSCELDDPESTADFWI